MIQRETEQAALDGEVVDYLGFRTEGLATC